MNARRLFFRIRIRLIDSNYKNYSRIVSNRGNTTWHAPHLLKSKILYEKEKRGRGRGKGRERERKGTKYRIGFLGWKAWRFFMLGKAGKRFQTCFLSIYLSINLYLFIYLAIYIYFFHLSIFLSVYLSYLGNKACCWYLDRDDVRLQPSFNKPTDD